MPQTQALPPLLIRTEAYLPPMPASPSTLTSAPQRSSQRQPLRTALIHRAEHLASATLPGSGGKMTPTDGLTLAALQPGD